VSATLTHARDCCEPATGSSAFRKGVLEQIGKSLLEKILSKRLAGIELSVDGGLTQL
jgi:pentose-5-phosphate-3-epimerase